MEILCGNLVDMSTLQKENYKRFAFGFFTIKTLFGI